MVRRNGSSAATAWAEHIEDEPRLARAAASARPVAAAAVPPPVRELLQGRSIGHALHPLVVQLPLGTLFSAVILDLLQGEDAHRQARLLVGVTALSALPAVATGVAEWLDADDRTQRVGVAHAVANAVGTTAALASVLTRRTPWSKAGPLWAGVAGMAYAVGGYLGGHMSLVRKYASHDEPSDREAVTRGLYRR